MSDQIPHHQQQAKNVEDASEEKIPATRPPGKVFKKCKSATFQIDGATYTIAVKESLIRDGHINKIKGELRTAVMSVLNKNVEKQTNDVPPLPEEARIVTDLIKEFFQWVGFRHSEQVLTAECGREEKMARKELERRLNIESSDPIISKMPLLYLIVLAHIHKST